MIEINSKNLDADLGGTRILKDINIHVSNKEFVGIIGPNGSGKSTLLRCIYRTLKPSKGTIFINDRELKNLPINETAKKIAVVAQHNEVGFDFSVLDMVLIGRSPHKKFMERDNPQDYEIALDALKEGKIIDYGTPKNVLTKELIKDLYDVDSEIILDENTDLINIVFKPL